MKRPLPIFILISFIACIPAFSYTFTEANQSCWDWAKQHDPTIRFSIMEMPGTRNKMFKVEAINQRPLPDRKGPVYRVVISSKFASAEGFGFTPSEARSEALLRYYGAKNTLIHSKSKNPRKQALRREAWYRD